MTRSPRPRVWLLVAGAALMAAAIGAGTIASRSSPPDPRPVPIAKTAERQSGRVFLSERDAHRAAATGLLPEGVRSILDVDRTLRHGEYRWDEGGVPPGRLDVRVDLDRQLISVFRGGHEIGVAVALYGVDGKMTPLGRFPIQDKRADYRSRTYDAPMPWSLWLTDDGVAVHGSTVRDGRGTNGCVGVPLDFARLLFEAARVGDVVEVVSASRAG